MKKKLAIKRLREVLESLKMNTNEFAMELGMKRSQGLYDVLNPKRENVGISKNLADKIVERFPQFSKPWLLTGEGEMLRLRFDEAKPLSAEIEFMLVPLVSVMAQASYPQEYNIPNYLRVQPTMPVFVDRNFKGKHVIFEMNGDSMYDGSFGSLLDGDKLLCREVKLELLQRSQVRLKDWYFVIVSKQEGVAVKQIVKYDMQQEEIHCHSLNPMFEDSVLKIDDVLEIYSVVKIVDRSVRG